MCRCHAALAMSTLAAATPLAALDSPARLVGLLVAFLMSLAVHESAHGWTAYRLGDPTAKLLGRVTLNPIPHIDPIGTLVLPILMYVSKSPVGLGWAKPTPVNMANMRNPVSGMVLVSIAGPISNLLLAVLFALLLRVTSGGGLGPENAGYLMLLSFVLINTGLAIFNLLPVPPLDGSKVVAGFLSSSARETYLRMDFAGLFLVLVLQASGMLDRIMGPPIFFVLRTLDRIADGAVFRGLGHLYG
jgi:Zn-dependent protease